MSLSGRAWLVLLILLLGSMAPSSASAQSAADTADAAGLSGDEEARMRFELGRRYYDTGRFADAAREFAEAHRLSGRTELLYNLFLAYRDAGDDVHAAETLRLYVPSLEAGERRTQLEARLRVLEARLSGTSTTTGTQTETETTTGSETGTTTSTETQAQTQTSTGSEQQTGGTQSSSGGGLGVVPWVVVGVGGALVVASIITGVLALDARSTLDRTCSADGTCPPGFESTRSSGQGLAIVTDVLWITGALAIGTGLVLAIVDLTSSSGGSDEARADAFGLGGACTSDGCFVSAQGRF